MAGGVGITNGSQPCARHGTLHCRYKALSPQLCPRTPDPELPMHYLDNVGSPRHLQQLVVVVYGIILVQQLLLQGSRELYLQLVLC